MDWSDFMSTRIKDIPNTEYYQKLSNAVDIKILHLKDSKGIFLLDRIDEQILKYFINNCIDKPWINHLLLVILTSVDRNLYAQTLRTLIHSTHPRLNDIFRAFNLNKMSEFNVEEHMYKYLKGDIYPNHSNSQRAMFLTMYRAGVYRAKRWVSENLPVTQQTYFEPFLFPMPLFDSRTFSFTKLAKDRAQDIRKNETDAIVPFLPKIRSEAHFRWNQIKRLRDTFQQAILKSKESSIQLPMEFHYEEPKRIGERFYFRLWDKPSFVLHHQEQFPDTVIKNATKRKLAYSEKNNLYFLEFVKAEGIHDNDEAEGLWFTELIEKSVLGQWYKTATEEECLERRSILSLWGYGDKSSTINPEPFYSKHKGIIGQPTFISLHKDKTEGIFFDIEPFYVACTFGLLAIDIFTTTGARVNELLQISNTKQCIQTKLVNERMHFSFYAIPKGRDEVEEFYISKQTMEIIQIISKMLIEHYGGKIPSVRYRHERSNLFPEEKPYFFQYNSKTLTKHGVGSSVRFLLHGLMFETQEGTPVTIKTHLLRHAFATEAVQRQKMPIDIVAKVLHQRDLTVTSYYSAPTPSQIAESVGELQDVISSYIDVDDALLRSPEELQKELKEYSEKVGVFNKVLGGTCVTDYVCPTKMACLGCKAKIPQPEQEHELFETIKVAEDMEKRFKKIGLEIEVRKAKEMRKQAKIELKEIDLIKKYREEQRYEPVIKSNTFW
ncbi:site-specific integrase [Bacillus cereus group sp. TH244-1LC]|uniref:site-specific integrase n=2 Tax=Bacillus cereus group TaxID=86661 RepID=UPI0022DF6BC5|nr:site-specific integrase [Bacillus cereus group sp. TH244-1LC]MDA1538311.1 site-specific integrase [Bacillus cereus group sp. TH244-1LC]